MRILLFLFYAFISFVPLHAFVVENCESKALQEKEPTAALMPLPDEDGRIQTLNAKGKMSPVLDPATLQYLDFISEDPTASYLDIGCGYGFSVEKALERHAAKVYALDLDARHLELMKGFYPSTMNSPAIVPLVADFSDDAQIIACIKPGSLRGVLLARVLHFFEGNKVERSFASLFSLLQPGGKIFINVLSPYIGTAEKFVPTFEENLQQGRMYPGECHDVQSLGASFSDGLSGPFHFFTPETLSALAEKHGFIVRKAEYAALVYSSSTLQKNGRENVILVAEKPKE